MFPIVEVLQQASIRIPVINLSNHPIQLLLSIPVRMPFSFTLLDMEYCNPKSSITSDKDIDLSVYDSEQCNGVVVTIRHAMTAMLEVVFHCAEKATFRVPM